MIKHIANIQMTQNIEMTAEILASKPTWRFRNNCKESCFRLTT